MLQATFIGAAQALPQLRSLETCTCGAPLRRGNVSRRARIGGVWRACNISPLKNVSSTDSNTRKESSFNVNARLPSESWTYLYASGGLLLGGLLLPPILPGDISQYTSHYTMVLALCGFGALHSGLASLRPYATQYIGERLYRVLFALVSLPSAGCAIAYFIAHRYDGVQLWQIQGVAGVHSAVWAVSVLSFALLYPATFNLLEVAAVQRPSFRIYESGITRITRHPQLWGQVLWCLAHSAWIGTSFTLVASLALVAHHAFGAWNGDRRLRDAHGMQWAHFAKRTSIFPFAAVLKGKQQLNPREFARPAYIGVAAFVAALYASHPAMLRAVGQLHW